MTPASSWNVAQLERAAGAEALRATVALAPAADEAEEGRLLRWVVADSELDS